MAPASLSAHAAAFIALDLEGGGLALRESKPIAFAESAKDAASGGHPNDRTQSESGIDI